MLRGSHRSARDAAGRRSSHRRQGLLAVPKEEESDLEPDATDAQPQPRLDHRAEDRSGRCGRRLWRWRDGSHRRSHRRRYASPHVVIGDANRRRVTGAGSELVVVVLGRRLVHHRHADDPGDGLQRPDNCDVDHLFGPLRGAESQEDGTDYHRLDRQIQRPASPHPVLPSPPRPDRPDRRPLPSAAWPLSR